MEIERKFLLATEPPTGWEAQPSEAIQQGYLAASPAGTVVRVRRKGAKRFLTVKNGGGLSRTEIELPLSEEQFGELWPLTEGIRLRKTRYVLPLAAKEGLAVELDIFEERLAGLRLAEVEFPTEEAAHAFQPPPYFGREVTHDPAYRNSTLAQSGLPPES